MRVLDGFKDNIRDIGVEVQKGRIVAFPTDTVYGLGAIVSNDESVKRVYKVKDRSFDSPLITLIGDKNFLKELTYITNEEIVEKLIEKFWPGALTIVLPKKEWVSDVVTAGGNSLGVRMPDNEIAIKLINASGGALATPSANKSGQLSPTSCEHVLSQFEQDEIDFVIDGGKTEKAIESTILDLTRGKPIILRSGAITKDEIEAVIGSCDEIETKKKGTRAFAKDIMILKREDLYRLQSDSLILAFRPLSRKEFSKVEVLSEKGDYKEASKNLCEALHRLLYIEGSTIYVEEIEEEGLGKVIMERIKKIAK